MEALSGLAILAIVLVPVLVYVGFMVLIFVGLLRLLRWLKVSSEEATRLRMEVGRVAEEISLMRKGGNIANSPDPS